MDIVNAAGMDETHGTYVDDECFDIHDYDDDTDHDTDDDTDDDVDDDTKDDPDDADDGGRRNLYTIKARGSRLKEQGSRFKAQGSRRKAEGLRIKAQGSRIKAQGSRIKDLVQARMSILEELCGRDIETVESLA